MRRYRRWRGNIGYGTAAVVIAAVAAPLVLSHFALQLTALFLPLAMLAISVDLLWGENRLMSFGQGAFFAAGGYVGGLILTGQTYNPIGNAASFLQASGGKSGIDQVLSALHDVQIAGVPVMALIVPVLVVGLAGLVVGTVIFRVADPEIYFPLVTLGIGVVAELWFNDTDSIGGANGLGGIPNFAGSSPLDVYVFNLGFLVAVVAAYWWFRRSKIGALWRALGDDPVRVEALGYRVKRIRAFGFAVSVGLAAVAGALYGATAGVIGPTLADITFSAQALIWVAVGGTGTLLGPVIGAVGLNWLQQLLSSNAGLESDWQLFLGLILIGVVLIAPGGLLGTRRADLLRRLPRLTGPPESVGHAGTDAQREEGALLESGERRAVTMAATEGVPGVGDGQRSAGVRDHRE